MQEDPSRGYHAAFKKVACQSLDVTLMTAEGDFPLFTQQSLVMKVGLVWRSTDG